MIPVIQAAYSLNLVEILVAATLAGFIVLLLGQNISLLTRQALQFKVLIQNEDSSLLALLLLQHQLQNSRINECTPTGLAPYTIKEHSLFITTLSETIYVNQPQNLPSFRLPTAWKSSDVIRLDDCTETRTLPVSRFDSSQLQSLHFPVSISIVTLRTYAFNSKQQLTLQINQGSHDLLFAHLPDFQLSTSVSEGLQIKIPPFTLHFKPE